jgi:XTP/dITP diphosphohydrolase
VKPGSRILVASGNPGKIAEFREILAAAGFDLVTPVEAGWSGEVVEDRPTLEGNAVKKAEAAARDTGLPALGDDSGLFVDALDGAPGVRSARYAGEEQDAAANCVKLLAALEGVPAARRGAEFRCVVALASPGEATRVFSGACRGRITDSPRGGGGFGYDPLFLIPELGDTFAALDPGRKHAVSHRGKALAGLRDHLNSIGRSERR